MKLFDANDRKLISQFVFYKNFRNFNFRNLDNKFKARTIAIHPNEEFLLVGFNDGSCKQFKINVKCF